MQTNSNKIIIALLVVVILILGFMMFKPKVEVPVNNQNQNPVMSGNTDDLTSFSITPGQKVSGTMTATGVMKSNYFFEANMPVLILDANKNVLKTGFATSTSDWMTSGPITFTTTLNFSGLSSGPAYIDIRNDNPSGDPANERNIYIPIVIQ